MENRPTFKNIHKGPFGKALQDISKFCDICFHTFDNDEQLAEHLSDFHQNIFRCEVCPNQPVTFTTEATKQEHDDLFHSEYKSVTMKDVYREGFFDLATPYYEAWSEKKRKLHPLCLLGFPAEKRRKLKQEMDQSDKEESESDEQESDISSEEIESETSSSE